MAAESYIIQAFDIIVTLFLWTWWIFLIGGLFAMKKAYERFPVDVVIIEKRGENLIKTNERAGRKVNKETQISFYQLKKCKETMPVYNFDWMLHNADKPMSIFEKIVMFLRPTIGTVFLFKYGSKQYKPINIGQKDSKLTLKEIKDTDGTSIFKYEYAQFDPRWALGVLDFEVVDWDNMNFMVQEQRASIERRKKKGDRMLQYLIPITIIAAAVVVSIFILKFSLDAGQSIQGKAADTGGGSGRLMEGISGAFTPGE